MNPAKNFPTNVKVINAGGSHEENPHGGVLIGVDKQGVPNLVEEGEVIWNNYVFSRRLNVPEEDKKRFNWEGETFADIAKSLNNKLKEQPNDSITKRSVNYHFRQLRQSLERFKAEDQLKHPLKYKDLQSDNNQELQLYTPLPLQMQSMPLQEEQPIKQDISTPELNKEIALQMGYANGGTIANVFKDGGDLNKIDIGDIDLRFVEEKKINGEALDRAINKYCDRSSKFTNCPFKGHGLLIYDECRNHGVNPMFFLAIMMHESGAGLSTLCNGGIVDGVYRKPKFNYFSINATDHHTYENAYDYSKYNPDGSYNWEASVNNGIVAGIDWVNSHYINSPEHPHSHTLNQMHLSPTKYNYSTSGKDYIDAIMRTLKNLGYDPDYNEIKRAPDYKYNNKLWNADGTRNETETGAGFYDYREDPQAVAGVDYAIKVSSPHIADSRNFGPINYHGEGKPKGLAKTFKVDPIKGNSDIVDVSTTRTKFSLTGLDYLDKLYREQHNGNYIEMKQPTTTLLLAQTTPQELTTPQEQSTPLTQTTPQAQVTPLEQTIPQELVVSQELTTPQEQTTPQELITPLEQINPLIDTDTLERKPQQKIEEEKLTLDLTPPLQTEEEQAGGNNYISILASGLSGNEINLSGALLSEEQTAKAESKVNESNPVQTDIPTLSNDSVQSNNVTNDIEAQNIQTDNNEQQGTEDNNERYDLFSEEYFLDNFLNNDVHSILNIIDSVNAGGSRLANLNLLNVLKTLQNKSDNNIDYSKIIDNMEQQLFNKGENEENKEAATLNKYGGKINMYAKGGQMNTNRINANVYKNGDWLKEADLLKEVEEGRYPRNVLHDDQLKYADLLKKNDEEKYMRDVVLFDVDKYKTKPKDLNEEDIKAILRAIPKVKRPVYNRTVYIDVDKYKTKPEDPNKFIEAYLKDKLEAERAKLEAERAKRAEKLRKSLNGPSFLRYAPAIGSAYQVLSDRLGLTNKPDYSMANRMLRAANSFPYISYKTNGNYMRYKPTDYNYLSNEILAESNANRRALLSQNGINGLNAIVSLNNSAIQNIGKARQDAYVNDTQRLLSVHAYNNQINDKNSAGMLLASLANQQLAQNRVNTLYNASLMRDNERIRTDNIKAANEMKLWNNIGAIGRDALNYNMVINNKGNYYDPRTGKYLYSVPEKETTETSQQGSNGTAGHE